MPTIRDVAKLAGVSTMTVSRVINNSGYVSRDARERVDAAITEIGYVPNSLARSLRFRQTKTLALLLTDITNPFYTTLARGVDDAASDKGFNVIICNTDESDLKQMAQLTALVQKRVDGVLLVPARRPEEATAFLRDQGIPLVVLDRRVPVGSVDSVRCDSVEGARQLAHLLLGLGHRRIAVLSGPEGISTAQDRVAGCRLALTESGLSPRLLQVLHDEYSQEGGYRMAQQILADPPIPTAVFAGNNFIAFGAYLVFREASLRVPEDVAMVAFDDLPAFFSLDAFFTVAAQPAYDMGRRAAELLLQRLGSGTAPPFEEVLLPLKIIVRRSSGGPRQHDDGERMVQPAN
jgi:LacI family transcriptional regulator